MQLIVETYLKVSYTLLIPSVYLIIIRVSKRSSMDSKLYPAFTNAYLSRTLDHTDEPTMNDQNTRNDDKELNKQKIRN